MPRDAGIDARLPVLACTSTSQRPRRDMKVLVHIGVQYGLSLGNYSCGRMMMELKEVS